MMMAFNRVALTMTEISTGTSITAPTVNVTITNASPIVVVNAPSNTGTIGSPISVTAAITDPGTADTHALEWSVTRNGQIISGAGTVGNPPTNYQLHSGARRCLYHSSHRNR